MYKKTFKQNTQQAKHSDSGTKITLQIKCLISATLKLTRCFTIKL